MNFPKGIPLIVMAGVIGVVASFSVYSYVNKKIAASVKPTSQVVVASNEIAPGTAISADQVKIVAWPRELVPAKATTSINAVQGKVVILPIAKGEPVLLTKLAPEGAGSGLGSLLDETKRAFTIRVDDVSGVAGFIKPGDHVDVLAQLPTADAKEFFSKAILQNIVVLSAGHTSEETADTSDTSGKNNKRPVLVTTVTLKLSLEQAEILNLASNQGKIRLVLRNRLNLASLTTQGVASSDLLGGSSRAKPEKLPVVAKKLHSIEVIKGLDRTQANL
jgi:pilus assembly protein CpaB